MKNFLTLFSSLFCFVISLAQPPSWTSIGLVPDTELDHVVTPGKLYTSLNLGGPVLGDYIRFFENDTYLYTGMFPWYNGSSWEFLFEVESENDLFTVVDVEDFGDGLIYLRHSEDEFFNSFLDVYYAEAESSELIGSFPTTGVMNNIGLYVHNDDIYLSAEFLEEGVSTLKILKYSQGVWADAFNSVPPLTSVNWINDMIYHQGDFYLGGGGMIDLNGDERNLWVLEDEEWKVVQDENENYFAGTPLEFLIHEDQLVIAHGISNAVNAPEEGVGSGILFWDGESWSSPQQLLNSQGLPYQLNVSDIEYIGDDLYALGTFFYAEGEVPMRYLARWDGSQWCGMQTFDWELVALKFAQYDGQVVHFTNQWSLTEAFIHDGVTFSPCTTPVSVTTIEDLEWQLYPNPASDQLSIQIPSTFNNVNTSYRVMNQLGQVVSEGVLSVSPNISTQHLSNGIYFLELNVNGIASRKQFVVTKHD